MRIVDTKGQLCPAPLIATKKVLKETPVGGSFMVLTDNQISLDNLSRFLHDNNIYFTVNEKEGGWSLTITKTKGDVIKPEAEEYCNSSISHFHKGDFIIVLTSDKMGDGDEDLGHLLMNNFMMALKDLESLPRKMIFYNNGVKLAANGSPVIEHLRDLEKMGVELLLCATCVNHYSLGASVGAGTLSNMYTIAEVMSSAGNIVRP